MISIKVHDAAGATRGRPEQQSPWGYTYSDTAITEEYQLPRSSPIGAYLTVAAEGAFDIYVPFSRSRVSSYTIASGDDFTAPDILLYTEAYDRPLTVRGEPSLIAVRTAADRYAATGIDFEGNASANVFAGMGGDDTLAGFGGRDRLAGGAGRDRLDSGLGNDRLDGGAGRDRLTGSEGGDTFILRSARESGGARPDLITDFVSGEDRIDLGLVDARSGTPADDAFRFIGGLAFGGRAGQLRYADGRLSGDTDGDGDADFAIALAGAPLAAADIIL